MAKSKKPPVIDWIYDSMLDPETGSLSRTVVTFDDVQAGIKAKGEGLKDSNPANFMKDIIRGLGASNMWPERLKDLRIGGRQVTGDRNAFEFVPYEDDQTEPFPSRFGYHDGVPVHRLESVSIPLATKALGRDDETYLIQVALKVRLVETHFALTSPLDVREISHLQIGIKQRLTEIDSLYAATVVEDGVELRVLITAEAKKRNQRILEEQVMKQVRAAFVLTDCPMVIPIAMTAADDGIYVAEFKAVRRKDLDTFDALELETEALYELVPRVPGIGLKPRAPRKAKGKGNAKP